MTQDIEWQVSEDFDILWEEWGEDTLAYHSGSGQTHLLNDMAVCVLRVLHNSSGNFQFLLAGLADYIDGELSDNVCQQVRELLDRFEALGLIEVRAG